MNMVHLGMVQFSFDANCTAYWTGSSDTAHSLKAEPDIKIAR